MNSEKIDEICKLLADFNFAVNEDVAKDLKCFRCQRVLINACIGPCECQLCRVCVDGLVESGCRVCPGNAEFCKESNLLNFYTDYRVQRKVAQLVLKCPQEMCTFESELINMNEHLRICPTKSAKCIFYGLGCDQSNIASAKMNEHLQLESYSHMEMLMGVIDNMRNEIDRLKENGERNKNEIDQLKERDERNTNEIYRLKENDERNKNEIRQLAKSNENNRSEIDRLKEDDRRNKNEIDQLKKIVEKNTSEMEMLHYYTLIKGEAVESLEGDIKKMKESKKNLKTEIGKTVTKVDTQLKEIREEWKDAVHCNEAMMKEANERYQTGMETRMNAAEKRMDALIDGTFLWVIDNVAQRRENKDFMIGEYLYGKREPYKMALTMRVDGYDSVAGTGLSIYLWIYSDARDQWLKWSLPADVSITITNKANPNASKMITKNYTIVKPNDNSNYRLNNDGDFDFLYDDLGDASLLIGDCFIVECRVDVLN